MVLSFPAAKAAPELGPLLAGLASFLTGFEDDPDQPQAPHLLRGIRHAQESELVVLPAPAPCLFRYWDEAGVITNHRKGQGGYFLSRHDLFHEKSIGRWHWSATRCDDEGRVWYTNGVAVMDDFGNLVEVPE